MAVLRIISYLPNPRIWKATIAARICGVELEVRGAPTGELKQWLWDFEARPLSDEERAARKSLERSGKIGFVGEPILKTDAFLNAHPFGTVPAAFDPSGSVGIFESNSIMRAVARLGGPESGLYGGDAYEASRIDSFLDASLTFARDAQHYLLALLNQSVSKETHQRASSAFHVYMAGIEQALTPNRHFIVGNAISIADICFVAELCLFSNEQAREAILDIKNFTPIWSNGTEDTYPLAMAHFYRLCAHPDFAVDVDGYMAK